MNPRTTITEEGLHPAVADESYIAVLAETFKGLWS